MVRLLVLGVLYERNAHGYEIYDAARGWGAETWANIKRGSIYHSLRQLKKEGFVLAMGVEREGNRPERLAYSITDAGRQAFLALLRKVIGEPSNDASDLYLGLVFLANLPAEEAKGLLDQRKRQLETTCKTMRANVAAWKALEPRLAWMNDALMHFILQREAELQWLPDVRDRVQDYPKRDWSIPPEKLQRKD